MSISALEWEIFQFAVEIDEVRDKCIFALEMFDDFFQRPEGVRCVERVEEYAVKDD